MTSSEVIRASKSDPTLNDNYLSDGSEAPTESAAAPPVNSDFVADSDDESLLSEVDEAQFADFDATAVQVAPELETLSRNIKASKRKRPEGDKSGGEKIGGKGKPRRLRRRSNSDDGFLGGEEVPGKRARKSKGEWIPGEKRSQETIQGTNRDENLSPEEQRRRALDRAMDAALKRPSNGRARKGEIVWLTVCLSVPC